MKLLQDKVKALLDNEHTGHDYEHTLRVVQNALMLAKQESCNQDFLIRCAYLHDVADHKFVPDPSAREAKLRALMKEAQINPALHQEILRVIECVSYSKALPYNGPYQKELQLLQDADRLDALGAVGIARTFAYGGKAGRKIYDSSQGGPDSITHFYEKLLKLADGMNSTEGKRLAKERHEFLEIYLRAFWNEIGGNAGALPQTPPKGMIPFGNPT